MQRRSIADATVYCELVTAAGRRRGVYRLGGGPAFAIPLFSLSTICEIHAIIAISLIRKGPDMSPSYANAHSVTSFWQYTARRSGGTRCSRRTPPRWNSRISAAKVISVADKFLQKQQEQRERRFANGRCGGNPAGGPCRSRASISRAIGTFPGSGLGSRQATCRRQSKAAGSEQSVVSCSNQRTAT
jgi:hypothetical protein